jgi:hypothetical protein
MIPALRAALAESGDVDKQQQRIHYAKNQTWSHRVEELVAATENIPQPKVAVIIITWNSVELSKRCVQSVLDDPLAPDIDVILVDNASTDETPQWLDEVEHEPRVRIIRNPDNRGFATACNQGLAAGAENDADILVILNNDIVTPGWATTLHRHLRNDPSIGLIGPVTNNIGNEAKVDTAYDTLEAMQPEQRRLTGLAAGKHFDIRVLAFFCVAMPRDVYASVGPLDEKFGTGFFECANSNAASFVPRTCSCTTSCRHRSARCQARNEKSCSNATRPTTSPSGVLGNATSTARKAKTAMPRPASMRSTRWPSY